MLTLPLLSISTLYREQTNQFLFFYEPYSEPIHPAGHSRHKKNELIAILTQLDIRNVY